MARDASFLETDKEALLQPNMGTSKELHITSVTHEEKFGKDHFSLRSQIFHIERKLKSEIQQRTSILAKAQQTELFNIREVLRSDRKKLAKVTEIAENTHRETQHDINKLRAHIKKDKIQETDRSSKMHHESVKNDAEIEHKVGDPSRYKGFINI